MQQVCKQTYLFIALDYAITDLKLQKYRAVMENLMLTLLQAKFEDLLKKDKIQKDEKTKKQKGKKQVGKILNALQVLQSEFPVGDEDSNNMKYVSILYNLEFSKPIEELFKVKKSQVCMLQCFSDQNIKNKQKANKKKPVVQKVQTRVISRDMPQLTEEQKTKTFAQIKQTLADIRKKYAQRKKVEDKERMALVNKRMKQIEKRYRQQSSIQKRGPVKRKKKN